MFNYVKFKIRCPKCRAIIQDFQTKDGDLFLDTVTFKEVHNFYSSCDDCGLWVDFSLDPRKVTLDMYKATFKMKHSKTKRTVKGVFKPEVLP